MARSRLCRTCGEFHDLEQAWPPECYAHFGVLANEAPMIRTDGMDPVRSMADGRLYDSRSRYYGNLKARGLEIVGNERAEVERRPELRLNAAPDIKRAIEELRSR